MTSSPVSPTNPLIGQMEGIITQNVVKYFASLPPEQKTVEKVEYYAQKQLNILMDGIMKESLDLRKKWKSGHPFKAKAAIDKESLSFRIQIIESEAGKY